MIELLSAMASYRNRRKNNEVPLFIRNIDKVIAGI